MNSRSSLDKLRIAANQNLKEKKYWKTKMSGDLEKISFAWIGKSLTVKARKYSNVKKFEAIKFTITDELFQKLIKLTDNVDFKLYMVLVAGLVAILYKYTGNEDIIIGSTIGRQEEEIDFINTVLALRNHISEDAGFKDLLLQTRQTVLEAVEYQNYPIEVLIEDLNMKFSKDEFPLFDILLIMENIHDKKYIRNIGYNMLFCFNKVDGYLQGALEYNSLIYDKEEIDRIIERYKLLLEKMLSDMNLRISRIEILSPGEKQSMLITFNNTDIPYPSEKLLHELFEQRVIESPDNTAVVFEDIQLSYSELKNKADRFSRNLRSMIKPGAVVAFMMPPGLEMIIGILSILQAGGIFLPIDRNFPLSRINFMLTDSGAEILLTTTDLLNLIDYPIRKINLEDNEMYHYPSSDFHPGITIDPVDCDRVADQITPRNPAYIIYTSGTTGKPKGVVVEHRNIVAYLFAFYREFNITEKDIVMQNSSYSFDLFIEELFPILIKGGKIVISHSSVKEDFYLLYNFMKRMSVGILDCTPFMLNEINSLNSGSTPNAIHTFISGGDILKKEYINRLIHSGNGRVRIYNTYGPTETTICAAYYNCMNLSSAYSHLPIGSPIANYRIYILDKCGRLAPINIPGELCIAGAGVSRGYLNRPELTAEKFIDNFFHHAPVSRLYRSGDLALWQADGNIKFLGRIDNQVKIRGYRIELKEIETKLLKHDSIKEAVVVEKTKNENMFLCVYYVSHREIEKSELQEFAARELPDYMVPRFFVPLERLPLTPGGKIDMKKLCEMDISDRVEYVAPRNEMEETLTKIWAEVLKLKEDMISINANFFELGGHSLSATIVTAKIHMEMGVKVPLMELFRFQTIRELAEYIQKAEKEKFISIAPVEKMEYYTLSSAQKRLYSVQQLNPDSTAYNIAFGFYLGENVISEKIKEPFLKLIERHEALRSSFETVINETVQWIHSEVEFEVETYKVELTAGGLKSDEIIKKFRRSFDLSKAPVFRVGLVETLERKFILLVDIHHIIVDAACTDILIQELIALYSGEELPHLRIQYKDYAEWQKGLRYSKEIRKQEEYWLKVYEGEIPLLVLNTDFKRPTIHDFQGDVVSLEIPGNLTLMLKKEILRHGAYINVFLAVYSILLSKLSDQEDIIVGGPVSGRTHIDLQGIIGMFLNMLPLRNKPQGNKSYMEFLEEVKENTLRALDNQDYQFDELVEKLNLKREPGRSPLVDATLVVLEREESLAAIRDQSGSMVGADTTNQEMPEVRIMPEQSFGITSKFDLELWISEVGNKIGVSLSYATSLFKRDSAIKILKLYFEILRQILENENILLKEITVSTDFLVAESKISKDIEFNF